MTRGALVVAVGTDGIRFDGSRTEAGVIGGHVKVVVADEVEVVGP